jgi:hypothetical protein
MVFSDIDAEPLFLYVTSSEPTLLAANIYGDELEFSGGTLGFYSICLTAIDRNGGISSNSFVVKVGDPVSTIDQSLSDLNIYPNPVEDLLYIRNATSTLDITIYNTSSSFKESYRNLENSVSIDLSDLPLGVYFMRIENPTTGAFSVNKVIRL